MATVKERVARGAAWLDTVRPGWVHKINLDRFIFNDKDSCILGQIFGWDAGVAEVMKQDEGTETDSIYEFGFDCGGDDMDGCEFPELGAAWREYITVRRLAAY